MRLAQFITANMERILAEFESFARSIATPGTMDIAALRDHAADMLTVIVRDLATPQTKREGADKSMGRSDTGQNAPDTPAQEHGSGRATSGFTFVEMVSEYRALRASVIRLWGESAREFRQRDLEDLVRFNEAIDQALAESTSRFTGDLDRTRETFLGILGHDLRSPLSAVVTSARFMMEEIDLTPTAHKLTSTILSSGERMNEMVADLLDFTRSRLGVAMPVTLEPLDLADLLKSSVDEITASAPDSTVTLETSGDLTGEFDGGRLRQVLSNLLSNAVNHGGSAGRIAVTAHAETDQVTFAVQNIGPPIPAEQVPQIFDPLTRHPSASHDSQHLGLGLYIARQVVLSHGGTIDVDSTSERGTTFTVCLPRHPPRSRSK